MALGPLVVYLLFAAVQHGEVMLGLTGPAASDRRTAFNVAGSATLYALVRTRLAERLSRDPCLPLPQTLFSSCPITWSCAITGPARGAVTAITGVTVLFAPFALHPRMALRPAPLAGQKRALRDTLAVTFPADLVQAQAGHFQEASVDRADRVLYRAKRPGRDRVETA